MTVSIPTCLDWLRGSRSGRAWLESLPGLVEACAELWNLEVGPPVENSYVSLVLPATTISGDAVILKIQYPDRESQLEAAALAEWDGSGAIRLLDHFPEAHSLLVERCFPGTQLTSQTPATALDVLIGLLPRLWLRPNRPFTSLEDEAQRWTRNLPAEWEEAGRPFPQKLLDGAIETMNALATTQGEQVLLHQDLHAANVLRAEREPWLAIDPKPLTGEREFALSPIIRSAELGQRRRDLTYRLDRLTDELGVDRDRSRLWAFSHAVAWGFEDGKVLPQSVEMASWLLAATGR